MQISLWFACISACILLSNAVVKYQNYAMCTFTPTTDEQHKMLKELQKNEAVIFMTPLANKNIPTQVAFAPHVQGDLMQAFLDNIKSEIVTNNLETLINREAMAEAEQMEINTVLGEEQQYSEQSFTKFWTLNDFMKFMDTMANASPNMVQKKIYGKSANNKDLTALEIKNGVGSSNKPVIFMDACTHAREWITPMALCYLTFQLLTNQAKFAPVLNAFDIVVAPMVNPDGYEYSWKTDRMWRKTRCNNIGSRCVGIDPNRNYAHGFGGEGSSNNPCDETYHGDAAFSCVEAKFLRNYLLSKNLLCYLSYHSYSQLLLLPYGTPAAMNNYPAEEKARDMKVAMEGCNALQKVHGETYKTGSTNEILYTASGVSSDWVKATRPGCYSYTWELRDKGANGFVLPAAQILPTCQESAEAFEAMCKSMMELENL